MTSTDLSAALLAWLRFGKRFPYVAAEVGAFAADVAAADDKQLLEVEVKVSIGDLRRDFESKGYKHGVYAGKYSSGKLWRPNRVYFAVPASLQERALPLLEAQAPRYGLLAYQDDPDAYSFREPWKRLSTVKRAAVLHDAPPPPAIHREFLLRMGSDLAHFHLMRQNYGTLFAEMRGLSQALVQAEGGPTP